MYNLLADFLHKRFRIDAHYFLKGGFWLSLTQLVVVSSGIITTALFAHFLSETDYGIYRYLIGLAVIFSSLSLTGLGQSILQTAAKGFAGFYNETLRVNFIFNIGVIFSSVAGSLYYWINENYQLAAGCLLISFIQPLINSFQFIPIYLQGARHFKEAAIVQSSKTLFIVIISIATLYFTNSVVLLLFSYLSSQLFANVLSHWLYRPDTNLRTNPQIFNQYLSYAKHTSARNIISAVALRLDTVIIFTQLGASQLAIYSIAVIIPEQFKGSLKNLASLLIQKYANHTDTGMLLKSVPRRSLELFSVLAVITAIYVLSAPLMYSLLFPKYPEAIFYSQLYSLVFLTHILYIPHSILQVKLEEKKLYYLSTAGAAFLISLLLILVPKLGILGAIISTLIYRTTFTFFTFLALPKS